MIRARGIKVLLSATALLLLAPAAQAQGTRAEQSVFDDYLNPGRDAGGFLRLPGLDFRSSVGFTWFSGGQTGSNGMGYYMGHFSYTFGSSLRLDWDVGVGSYLRGPEGMNDYEVFIPNVDLTYRPSEKMMLKLQFRQGGLYRHHSPGMFGRRF